MKLNIKNKILTSIILASLILVSSASISNSHAATTEVEIFPDMTIVTTADIDIKTANSVLLSKMSRQTFFDTEHISNLQVITTGLRMTIKSELSISSSDVDDVSIDPAVEVTDDVSSWQLELFLDKGTPYIKNETDQTDAYAISDDFNSNTYNLLAIPRARSNATNATTIIISYSDALTGNISDPADTTNTTILNELVPVQKFLFYRLDLEQTNSSRPYILHIAFDELMCDAIYIYSLPATQDFRDERYEEIWMGLDANPINVSKLNDTTEWQKIYKLGADYTEDFQDNTVRGVGFETADEFEDTLYETWVKIINNEIGAYLHAKAISIGDIDDYKLTECVMKCTCPPPLSKDIYDTLRVERNEASAAETYVKETRDNTIRRFTITTAIKPNILKENDDAEGISDVSNALIAVAQRSKGSSTSFATNILDKVTGTTQKISEPLAAFMVRARLKAYEHGISDAGIIAIIVVTAGIGTAASIATIVLLATRKK
ncbi:MAG: hypothetical protein HZR80_07405 [Candidatus Heimdallarchaeota archaeon]